MGYLDGYKQNLEYYDSLMKQYDDANHVGSWAGVDQTPRYKELIDADFFSDATILEIGCGLGGFLDYLIQSGFKVAGRYCGVDIVDKMQEINEKKYPFCRFLTCNIVEEPLDEMFDIVVLCGVFNHKTPNGNEYMKRLLESSFKYCKKMLSFNFISSYVNFLSDDTEYHNPNDIMNFCIENLSSQVRINHHYWKCDTSCKVYKK